MLLFYDGWQFFHTRNMGWTCTIYILDYVVAVSLKSVLVLQSCRTLCKLTDCSLPGSSAYGMLQARIMEWVVIPFSKGSSRPRSQIQIFCNAGGVFIIWAITEAQVYAYTQAYMYVVSVSKCFRILYFLFLFKYRWFGNTIFS